MERNRSMPPATVIPELAYSEISAAIDWLTAAFGFTLRLRIGDHRAQLHVPPDGAVVLTALADGTVDHSHAVMVRVEDADAHHARAVSHGAHILRSPTNYPYGERQYTAADLAGHIWTFSQSIADIDPLDWGGSPS